jgi:hypothetical protein
MGEYRYRSPLQKRFYRPLDGLGPDDLRGMPAAANQGRHDIVCVSDNNQVERIAVFVSIRVGGAARKFFEHLAQLFKVFDVDDLIGCIQRIEIDHLIVGFEVRIRDDERKALDVLTGDEIDIHGFEAFVHVGEHKARFGRSRSNRVFKLQLHKFFIKLPVGFVRSRVKRVRRLGGCEVVGVHARWQKPVCLGTVVLDFDPHRLDEFPFQFDAVDRLGLRRGRNRDRDRHIPERATLSPFSVGRRIGRRRPGRRASLNDKQERHRGQYPANEIDYASR